MIDITLILFAISGGVISCYLYLKKKNNEPVMCLIGHDCNAVINSKYSKFFGIPNEFLGLCFYLFLITGTIVLASTQGGLLANLAVILIGSAAIACIYSAYLTYVQFFVLKQICGFCLVVNALNVLILILSVVHYM